MEHREVADVIWRKYVAQALGSGHLQVRLDLVVIEGGLSKVQEGLDR